MTVTAEITVYVELPSSLTRPLDLALGNWSWVHCLTFPIGDLLELKLSCKLYKWIRYAIGVVVGAQGDLFDEEGCPIDYDSELPIASIALRYHLSDAEKGRMFPTDPHFACATVSSSVTTARVPDFRRDVERRDGVCPVSGLESLVCQATHLVAHSKGDLYIQQYTRRRGRCESDYVESIDDIRNGVFLNFYLHVALGKQVAFLVTPNFALDTTDIKLEATSKTEPRCTAQILAMDKEKQYLLAHSSNPGLYGSSVHIPSTTSPSLNLWPPPVLFDAVYASAILANFASPKVKKDLTDRWSDIIYPGGVRHLVKRPERHDYHGPTQDGPDGLDMLAMFPYLGIPKDELPRMLKEMDATKQSEEHARVEDKVNNWRDTLSSIDNM